MLDYAPIYCSSSGRREPTIPVKTTTLSFRLLPALMIAIAAAVVTQPIRAVPINDLVITENSSTSLTATLNGNPLSVTFNFANNWTIALTGVAASNGNSTTQLWAEPEAFFTNAVDFFSGSPDQLPVTSDFLTSAPGLPDGTQDKTTFTLNGNPLYVTFFDKGDVATAPDTGTTASLFGLSLAGLAFLRRKLS
jgi:hypothetical protein